MDDDAVNKVATATAVEYYMSSTPVHDAVAASITTTTAVVATAQDASATTQLTSTPSLLQPYRLKSQSYKLLNHTRRRSQCSPYHRAQPQSQPQPQPPTHQQTGASISTSSCDFSSETDDSSSLSNVNHHAHPTTPVSSSLLLDESLSPSTSLSSMPPPLPAPLGTLPLKCGTASVSSSSVNHNEPHVTPITATTSASSSSDRSSPQSSSNSNQAYSLSSSSSVKCCSIEAMTRSTSLGSLHSEDMQSVKSTYSSQVNSSSHGVATPAYSDLPDSPGECSFDTDAAATTAAVLAVQAQAKAQYYQQLHQHYLSYKNNTCLTNMHQMVMPAYATSTTRIGGYLGKNTGRSVAMGPTLSFGICPPAASQLPPPQEELSVMTVDSNPKSNDITVVERTVLTSTNNNLASFGGGVGGGGGGGGGMTSSSSNEITAITTTSSSERNKRATLMPAFVRGPPGTNASHLQTSIGSASSAYFSAAGSSSLFNSNNVATHNLSSSVHMSPWTATSSQIYPMAVAGDTIDSGVFSSTAATLPSSTPDLTHMRNILSTRAKTTPISSTAKSIFDSKYSSNQGASMTTQNFTPPVKLSNMGVGRMQTTNVINRALFTSAAEYTPTQQTDLNESEEIKHYTCEEIEDSAADDLRSMVSLPSCIKADNDAFYEDTTPLHLDPLLVRVSSRNQAQESPIVDEALRLETTTDSDIGSPCLQHHHMVSLDTSENLSGSVVEDVDDDDEDCIDEFINENFNPKSGTTADTSNNSSNNKENSEENSSSNSSDGSGFDGFDENVVIPEMQGFVNPLKQEAGLVAARMLPKIEEESDEERVNMSIASSTSNKKSTLVARRLSTNSIRSVASASSSAAAPPQPLAKVVLTKTARLRMAQRLKESTTTGKPYCFKTLTSTTTPAILNKFSTSSTAASKPNRNTVLTSINTNQINKI